MTNLSKKTCRPCQGGISPLKENEINKFLSKINGWQVIDMHHLLKDFAFADFKSALAFVNQIAGIAEVENHHPELILSWGKVVVSIWTHKIDGLHENDFILAAKIDELV